MHRAMTKYREGRSANRTCECIPGQSSHPPSSNRDSVSPISKEPEPSWYMLVADRTIWTNDDGPARERQQKARKTKRSDLCELEKIHR